jgi:hypothetical protein
MKLVVNITRNAVLAFSCLLLLALGGCKKSESGENAFLALTTMSIEDPVRHYYPVLQGVKQKITVKVTNTGREPLKLYKVQPSCGCTIAKFPDHAIAAGEDAFIDLEYDSNKNIGYVGIYTTISANTKEHYHTVFFDLNVVPDALYTKDYEELHHIEEEKKLLDKDGKEGNGAGNGRDYVVDSIQPKKITNRK